jgi:HSP20 family molecular chaperone IbpA
MDDDADKTGHLCCPNDRGRRTLPQVKPATDILEREDGYYLYLDLPGVGVDSLRLELKDNELSVRGTARLTPASGERFVEVEFSHGEFRRAFTLTEAVDRERIRARLKDGVLEIFLPRTGPGPDEAQPRRIEIKAG